MLDSDEPAPNTNPISIQTFKLPSIIFYKMSKEEELLEDLEEFLNTNYTRYLSDGRDYPSIDPEDLWEWIQHQRSRIALNE